MTKISPNQQASLDLLQKAPFPLMSSADIAQETGVSPTAIGSALSGLRIRGLVLKRIIYSGRPAHPYAIRMGNRFVVPRLHRSYWFLPEREIEVYPLGAEKQLHRDRRR